VSDNGYCSVCQLMDLRVQGLDRKVDDICLDGVCCEVPSFLLY